MSTGPQVPQSDVSRPSALPTASLRNTQNLSNQQRAVVEQNSADYLTQIEDEWNKKVDVEVETLVDGMVDLVALASIGDKDKFKIAQEAFQAQLRSESMIRAAHSLLSITHSMKLLLLLSDEAQIAYRRDAEMKSVQEEREDAKRKVATLLDGLISRKTAWRDQEDFPLAD